MAEWVVVLPVWAEWVVVPPEWAEWGEWAGLVGEWVGQGAAVAQ